MKSNPIELFRPSVPALNSYMGYLTEIDKNSTYSNFGPMYVRFRDGLAAHFELQANQLELFSSGTMALYACLFWLKKDHRPYCILPSWTFVATAQAVIAAGLIPVFVDVDLDSMQLNAESLEKVPEEILNQTAAIIVVSPFGAPVEFDGIKKFTKRYGIEIVADCAAGFDTLSDFSVHSIVSLHATKTFGIGEGGLLVSPSTELISLARSLINFGFQGQRTAIHFGINGKLSEMHCAVGLAALDTWGTTRRQYLKQAQVYWENLEGEPILLQKGWGKTWVSSNCVIRLESSERKLELAQRLSSEQIQTRDWWNQGCHLEPAFQQYLFFDAFGHTKRLADISLGIPFYKDITTESILRITEKIHQTRA